MSIADRIRVKFALARGAEPTGHACPPTAELLAWHEHHLGSEEARAMQQHVAHCDHCFALWSGLLALDAEVTTQSSAAKKRSWWGWRGWLALPAVALGGVAVSLWMGLLSGAPMPLYEIGVQGALDARGGSDPTQPLTLRDETHLEVVLLPATAASEPIAVVAYALANDRLSELETPARVTDKGVASIEGFLGRDIVVPPETTRLLIVVGRHGNLPSAQRLRRALADQTQVREDDWQAWSLSVEVVP